MVNRLLADATPIQAYCLGLVSAAADIDGLEAPASLLQQTKDTCRNAADVEALYAAWRAKRTTA
jgi:hypothetical protein